MNVKNMYKNAKKHLGKMAFIPLAVLNLSGCVELIERPIYSGEINEKKVVVYDVKNSFWNPRLINGTKIVVSDKAGNIEKILYDDNTGKLGDEAFDYVRIYQKDNKDIKYTPNYYINEKGQKIKFNSDIGKELKSIINGKFEEYDKEYQKIKTKISKSIEKKL